MRSPAMKLPIQSPSPCRNPRADSRRRGKRGIPRLFRLGLEALETRVVPSTFAVQVFDDGVPVTGTTIPNYGGSPNSLAFLGSSDHFDSNIVMGSTNSPGTAGGAVLKL